MDFFGGMQSAELTHDSYPIDDGHKPIVTKPSKQRRLVNVDQVASYDDTYAPATNTSHFMTDLATFAIFAGTIGALTGAYTLFSALEAKLFN